MTEQTEIMRVLTSSPADLVRSLFKQDQEKTPPIDPRHSDVPALRGAEVAAVYYNLRVAGDFYEFLRVGPSRVLFALLDLAGEGRHARDPDCHAERLPNQRTPVVRGSGSQ
jgi:serine phosphatase RsbU (regulator of sigma subunit)